MTIKLQYDRGLSEDETLSNHKALAGRLRHLLMLLLAKIHAHSLDMGFDNPKFHHMVREAARLTRHLVKTQLCVYRAQMKFNMLANPHWRACVIAQLGGHHGFARWTRRFIFMQQIQLNREAQSDGKGSLAPAAKSVRPQQTRRHHSHAATTRQTPRGSVQFRLPPIPRVFYGRVDNVDKRPANTPRNTSPLGVPIIVTPAELMPDAYGPAGAKPLPTDEPAKPTREDIVAMIEALPPPKPSPKPP